MSDAEGRLGTLASRLDEAAPVISLDEIEDALAPTTRTAEKPPRRLRPVWIATAAATATLVLVGIVAVLGIGDAEPVDTATTPDTPTTIQATTPPSAATTTPEPTEPATTTPATTSEAPNRTVPAGGEVSVNGWTRWSLEPGVFDDAWVRDIVDAGSFLVAVGGLSCPDNECGGATWASDDGITWTRIDLQVAEGTADMGSVAAGPSGLVAVGSVYGGTSAFDGWSTGYAWHSEDGVEWVGSELPGPGSAGAVVATESGYVAVGTATRWVEGSGYGDGVVWTSEDGVTWERQPDDGAVFQDALLYHVAAGQEGLVAVGVVASSEPDPSGDIIHECCFAAWTSPNGTEWTQAFVEPRTPDELFLPGYTFDLATNGSEYVAGAETHTWYSPDGRTWEKAPPETGYSVSWAGDRWIMGFSESSAESMGSGTSQWTSDGVAIWESTDGRAWTPVAAVESGLFEPNTSVYTVRPGGPGLIAFGSVRGPEGSEPALWTWTGPGG